MDTLALWEEEFLNETFFNNNKNKKPQGAIEKDNISYIKNNYQSKIFNIIQQEYRSNKKILDAELDSMAKKAIKKSDFLDLSYVKEYKFSIENLGVFYNRRNNNYRIDYRFLDTDDHLAYMIEKELGKKTYNTYFT